MKKLLCVFIALLTVFTLSACGEQKAEEVVVEATEAPAPTVVEGFTEEEIEAFVVNALFNEIDSKYDTADAGSCRYEIASMEKKGQYVYVYGSVDLYDKYGKFTTGWIDGSGTPYRRFEVLIHESGFIYDCEVK